MQERKRKEAKHLKPESFMENRRNKFLGKKRKIERRK